MDIIKGVFVKLVVMKVLNNSLTPTTVMSVSIPLD